jgi:hypothetical protein
MIGPPTVPGERARSSEQLPSSEAAAAAIAAPDAADGAAAAAEGAAPGPCSERDAEAAEAATDAGALVAGFLRFCEDDKQGCAAPLRALAAAFSRRLDGAARRAAAEEARAAHEADRAVIHAHQETARWLGMAMHLESLRASHEFDTRQRRYYIRQERRKAAEEQAWHRGVMARLAEGGEAEWGAFGRELAGVQERQDDLLGQIWDVMTG